MHPTFRNYIATKTSLAYAFLSLSMKLIAYCVEKIAISICFALINTHWRWTRHAVLRRNLKEKTLLSSWTRVRQRAYLIIGNVIWFILYIKLSEIKYLNVTSARIKCKVRVSAVRIRIYLYQHCRFFNYLTI